MHDKGQIYSYILVLIFISLFLVNYLLLNGRADPFLATTVVQANSIIVNGRLSEDYFCNVSISATGSWSWQGHTCSYTSSMLVVPGITLSVLSLLMGITPIIALYIPVNGLIMLLAIAIIGKTLYSGILGNASTRWLKLLALLTFIVASTWFSMDNILGRFYTLQYHAYSFSIYVLSLAVLIKYIAKYDDRRLTVLYIILSFVLVNIHYRAIYLIIGGLIGNVVYNALLLNIFKPDKQLNKLYRTLAFLAVSSIILVYFKEFFIQFVGSRLDIAKLVFSLSNYASHFYEFSQTGQTQISAMSPQIMLLQELSSKIFTYIALPYMIAVLILQMRWTRFLDNSAYYRRVITSIFAYLLGSSVTVFLAYFYAYGTTSRLGINDPWLLLLVLPVSYLLWRCRNNMVAAGRIIVITTSVILICCSSALVTTLPYLRIGYTSFTPPPLNAVESSAQYLAIHMPREGDVYRTLTAGFSTASYLYAFISTKHFETIEKITIYNFPRNTTNVKEYNFVIITDVELNKGIFTDIFVDTFLPPRDVETIYMYMLQKRNLIYNGVLKCFN